MADIKTGASRDTVTKRARAMSDADLLREYTTLSKEDYFEQSEHRRMITSVARTEILRRMEARL